ncbi:hypothetical protein COCNU_scaffold002109G000010 [Cocos nucifera]|nr:hypothetical protein [Cocos nucifera]
MVQNDGSKRAKVGVSSSNVPASIIAASEVIVGVETTLTVESGHQMLTHIKRVHRQVEEAQKTQKDLQAKIHHLQERINEVEHLAEEKTVDIRSLQGALLKEEFVLVGLKATLALKEERKKEAKNRVAKMETQMAKSILEAMIGVVEEFKTSPEMQNLNVEFGQEVFIKDFELYEGRVARMFSELDLSFLEEEEDYVDVGPSSAIVHPTFENLASGPSEPIAKVPEPVQKPEAAESDLAPPSVIPPEVEILE